MLLRLACSAKGQTTVGSASDQLQLPVQPKASAAFTAANGIQYGSVDSVGGGETCWLSSGTRSQQHGSRRYRCRFSRNGGRSTFVGLRDVGTDMQEQIPERPPPPQRINLRDIERSSAGRDFFEQNAWANPSVAHAMASSQRFATPVANHPATGIDMLMMSAPTPFSRNTTPSNPRTKSVTKISGTTRDTERIQTSHNSGVAGTISTMGEATEVMAPAFPARQLERDEFFGRLGSSHPTAAPVSVVSGARYPP